MSLLNLVMVQKSKVLPTLATANSFLKLHADVKAFLKSNRTDNFSKALNFEGFTGPPHSYLYSYHHCGKCRRSYRRRFQKTPPTEVPAVGRDANGKMALARAKFDFEVPSAICNILEISLCECPSNT